LQKILHGIAKKKSTYQEKHFSSATAQCQHEEKFSLFFSLVLVSPSLLFLMGSNQMPNVKKYFSQTYEILYRYKSDPHIRIPMQWHGPATIWWCTIIVVWGKKARFH
jgi:hypothetical protein